MGAARGGGDCAICANRSVEFGGDAALARLSIDPEGGSAFRIDCGVSESVV
jgi:hypothetical protein